MTTRRGFALGMTISLLAVVFLLGIAFSARAGQQLENTTHTVCSLQAEYLSDAGVRWAMTQVAAQLQARQQWMRNNGWGNGRGNGQGNGPPWQWQPFQATFKFSTGTVQVNGTPLAGASTIHITSRGTTPRIARLIDMIVDWNGAVVSLKQVVL